MKDGNDGGYMPSTKKTKLNKCFKNDDFSRKFISHHGTL
jgi:hypothetical protein